MRRRDNSVYLREILDSINRIQDYIGDLTFEDLANDPLRQDGVIRQLEIIGEASRVLPPEFKSAYPDVPWQKMVGMRHVIIHEYFQVDLQVIWDTVKGDLPPLKKQIQEILRSI